MVTPVGSVLGCGGACSRSTSAARSSRSPVVDEHGTMLDRVRRRRRSLPDAEALFRTLDRAGRTHVAPRAAVRGGAASVAEARWNPAARTVSPLNIPQWRAFPLRRDWPRSRLGRRPGVRRQRREGARPRRGVDRRGAWARATTSRWSCRPASAEASSSTGACSTARPGNAGHIGHVIVGSGRTALRVWRARAASRPRRRVRRSRRGTGRPAVAATRDDEGTHGAPRR